MAASIVQTAINGKNGGGTSVTATFASAPTPGNILLWIVSRYSHRSTAPSNGGTYPFSQQFLSPSAQGDAAVDVYTRTVATGDPTVWEMDELFGTDSMTACIVEVAGSDGNPGAWFMPSTGVFASPLSQSVTGTAGQLLIVGVAPNGGSTFGGLTDITPSGYTEDAEFVPAGSSLSVGHTTATGSAQSIGASWDGTNGDCVQVVIAVTSAPVPSRWHVGVIGMAAAEPTAATINLIRGASVTAASGTTITGPQSDAPALTPAAGDLLIVTVDWEVTTSGPAADLTLTADTFGGLTWTRVQTSRVNSHYDPNSLTSAIFYATATGGTAGTAGSYVTVTGDIGASRSLLNLFHVTAPAGLTPTVAQSASAFVDGPTPTDITPTLASAPSAGSLVFTHVGEREGSGTVLDIPAGYTNPLAAIGGGREASQSGSFGILQWIAYNDNTTDPAAQWNVTTAAFIDSLTANIVEIQSI